LISLTDNVGRFHPAILTLAVQWRKRGGGYRDSFASGKNTDERCGSYGPARETSVDFSGIRRSRFITGHGFAADEGALLWK